MRPNYKKYREVSDEFKGVLADYDPAMECAGLDEACMDITDYLVKNKLNHDLGKIFIAKQVREQVYQKIKITSSCGISCNKMMAKICSELNKPNG